MFDWFSPQVYNSGYMPTQDGHEIFYQEAGHPKGKPVLVFHGGPGGALRIHHAKPFNRRKYRIIFFDQRGCGKSTPTGELKHNTTQNILFDSNKLLEYLNVKDKVIILGSSWGSTLGLLFAQNYPEKVEMLLLSKIFLANQQAKDWEQKYSTWLYPDIWESIVNIVGDQDDVSASFAKMINSDDLNQQLRAASSYGRYERILGEIKPELTGQAIDEFELNAAKIFINYAAQNFMLKDNEVLQHIDKIANIPTLIVHNRLDLVCPLQGAYILHKKLPLSKLVIVPEKGHGGKLITKTIYGEIKKFLAVNR